MIYLVSLLYIYIYTWMKHNESTHIFNTLIHRQQSIWVYIHRHTSLVWLTCPIVDKWSAAGGVLRYLHGCQAGPIQLPAPQPSFMPQISQMSQKTAVMDSVTVGDLSMFHIDIGYWQIYAPIYTHIYQHVAPLSLSWLIFVLVSAAGLFFASF